MCNEITVQKNKWEENLRCKKEGCFLSVQIASIIICRMEKKPSIQYIIMIWWEWNLQAGLKIICERSMPDFIEIRTKDFELNAFKNHFKVPIVVFSFTESV